MAIGPGKYDELAAYCMREAQAEAVVVIVFNGTKGHGMSGKVSAEYELAINPAREIQRRLPTVLRAVARTIEDAPPDAFQAPS